MQTYSLLFYIKKNKGNSENSTIYARITVNGRRKEISTGKTIQTKEWNSKAGKVNGNSANSKSLNIFLESIRTKIFETYSLLFNKGKIITSENIKNEFLGGKEKKMTLIDVFSDHNNQMADLIGNGYAKGTWERYETSLRHVQQFMRWKYNISDIFLSEISPSFISNFEFFLRTVRNCANNSAVKYVMNLQKIINICLDNEWMSKNPFTNYKSKIIPSEVRCLTEIELEKIQQKTISNVRLDKVRDIFIFCCFTGLSYAEVKKLSHDNIKIHEGGEGFIKIIRTKTKVKAYIPLLQAALEILQKYKSDDTCIKKNVLPVLSNQKTNEYLKEIGAICEIDFDITFHTARHTFATTITLNNGVPIETVSKMLGHTNIQMTQHYAKIQEQKIQNDMELLKNVLIKKKQ